MVDKIFQRAEDKFVATRIIYLNSEDSKFYYDSNFENEVDAADMQNLFLKGVICDDGIGLYAAMGYDETNGITFAIPSGSE